MVWQNAFFADIVCSVQLWPGATHWPDFMNPKTVSWWQTQIQVPHLRLSPLSSKSQSSLCKATLEAITEPLQLLLHCRAQQASWSSMSQFGSYARVCMRLQGLYNVAPIDGIWLDMNEVSNYCAGDVCIDPGALACLIYPRLFQPFLLLALAEAMCPTSMARPVIIAYVAELAHGPVTVHAYLSCK